MHVARSYLRALTLLLATTLVAAACGGPKTIEFSPSPTAPVALATATPRALGAAGRSLPYADGPRSARVLRHLRLRVVAHQQGRRPRQVRRALGRPRPGLLPRELPGRAVQPLHQRREPAPEPETARRRD